MLLLLLLLLPGPTPESPPKSNCTPLPNTEGAFLAWLVLLLVVLLLLLLLPGFLRALVAGLGEGGSCHTSSGTSHELLSGSFKFIQQTHFEDSSLVRFRFGFRSFAARERS
jgi:hypothetical protein